MTTETLPAPVETVTPIPAEVVTSIRPSEALRLGRLIRPRPAMRALYRGRYAACAIGAMALGFGMEPPTAGFDRESVYDFVEARIPWKSGYWRDHIVSANDAGYSDAEIIQSLEAYGL